MSPQAALVKEIMLPVQIVFGRGANLPDRADGLEGRASGTTAEAAWPPRLRAGRCPASARSFLNPIFLEQLRRLENWPGAGRKPPSVLATFDLAPHSAVPGRSFRTLGLAPAGKAVSPSPRALGSAASRIIAPARLCRFCALTGTLAPPACAGPPRPAEGGLSSAAPRPPSVAHRPLAQ